MPGLNDWIDIFERHAADDSGVTLSPTEVVRLRHDLKMARLTIVSGQDLLARYDAQLDRSIALAERFREAYEKTLALAKKFADAV